MSPCSDATNSMPPACHSPLAAQNQGLPFPPSNLNNLYGRPPSIETYDKILHPNGPPHFIPCDPTHPLVTAFESDGRGLKEFARTELIGVSFVDIRLVAKDRESEYEHTVVFHISGNAKDVKECEMMWMMWMEKVKVFEWPVLFIPKVDMEDQYTSGYEQVQGSEELKAEWANGSLMAGVITCMKERK